MKYINKSFFSTLLVCICFGSASAAQSPGQQLDKMLKTADTWNTIIQNIDPIRVGDIATTVIAAPTSVGFLIAAGHQHVQYHKRYEIPHPNTLSEAETNKKNGKWAGIQYLYGTGFLFGCIAALSGFGYGPCKCYKWILSCLKNSTQTAS